MGSEECETGDSRKRKNRMLSFEDEETVSSGEGESHHGWRLGTVMGGAVLARRAVQEYIITAIKEVLRIHFNRAVDLKVYELFTDFTFLVTSGPFVYTAISVINVLINSKLVRDQTPLILSVKPSFLVPESRFQVQTGLKVYIGEIQDGRLTTAQECSSQ
ncbi:UPF0606 protein KIAA1549 [Plecturocebus cupreus]